MYLIKADNTCDDKEVFIMCRSEEDLLNFLDRNCPKGECPLNCYHVFDSYLEVLEVRANTVHNFTIVKGEKLGS